MGCARRTAGAGLPHAKYRALPRRSVRRRLVCDHAGCAGVARGAGLEPEADQRLSDERIGIGVGISPEKCSKNMLNMNANL